MEETKEPEEGLLGVIVPIVIVDIMLLACVSNAERNVYNSMSAAVEIKRGARRELVRRFSEKRETLFDLKPSGYSTNWRVTTFELKGFVLNECSTAKY